MRRGWLFVFVLAWTLPLTSLVPGPVAVAQAPEGHAGKEPQGGPQIFTPVRLDLGIWTLVVFLLLLYVLGKYAWKPMLEGLHNRERNLHGALEEARAARDDAHKLRDQFAQEMNKAHEKVRDILDEGRRDAERLTADIMAKARADIQAERDRLHRELQTARDQALQELWSQTAQLAALVSTKTIRRQLTPDDHRRFVDEALADLRRSGGDRHTGGTNV
jgi:F-type H+-transporting ATPase subunit b